MRKLVIALCLLASPALADDPILPDPHLTPGDVLPVTAEQVCVKGYAKSVRHVSGATKHQVYVEYGMTEHPAGTVEIDHLISLELGGSNDIKNLWPESYLTLPWNAHVKDDLENTLHEKVCDGTISLLEAQKQISSDWIAAYQKWIAPSPQ